MTSAGRYNRCDGKLIQILKRFGLHSGQIDRPMRMSDMFEWLGGVLKPLLDVLPKSEAKKEDTVNEGRNITSAENHNECNHVEALIMHDHVEERLNEIRLKKAEFSSSMKERFQIATNISELRQKSALMPDHVFKVELQKNLDAYSQADIAVKGVRQDLGRLELNHLCCCDTEIAVFKRRPSSESSSQGSKPTPRFPNFPFSFSQSARDASRAENSAEARSASPVRRSKRFTRASAPISPDALAVRARSSER